MAFITARLLALFLSASELVEAVVLELSLVVTGAVEESEHDANVNSTPIPTKQKNFFIILFLNKQITIRTIQ
jgi:hypothetical protein